MRASNPEGSDNTWFELEGKIAPCTARARIRTKENTISIFDFWTHGPLQGKGYGKKLLKEIRKKFKWVIIQAIGEVGLEATKKAESFWLHMYETGLVDELHYQRKVMKSVVREKPWQKTSSRKATGTKFHGATSRKPATTTPILSGRSTKKSRVSRSS